MLSMPGVIIFKRRVSRALEFLVVKVVPSKQKEREVERDI
jgi:hypothetical protein